MRSYLALLYLELREGALGVNLLITQQVDAEHQETSLRKIYLFFVFLYFIILLFFICL
jgi:hypothetical protein